VNDVSVSDTISGIATPLGEGGIGIIRISGTNALSVAEKMVKLSFRGNFRDIPSHTIHYGYVHNPKTGEKVDEILLLVMKGPRSFTAEDVVEIHCHGGLIPVRNIYELTLQYGARPAEPGEFTKRAFLNGRIDLAQAEAVIDLIRSKTDANSRVALHQLEGKLSRHVNDFRAQLLEMIAYAEASIDFPEEDIEEITAEQIATRTLRVIQTLEQLLDSAHSGKIIREGMHTVIIGKPNVGKSSLLNALLGEKRAIVTDVPGTTRDSIEEYINVKGIPLRIVDTAGIRATEDTVEKIGVEKAQELFQQADLVLMMLDASQPLSEEDNNLLRALGERPSIIVINKADLPSVIEENHITSIVGNRPVLHISVKEHEGISTLEEQIAAMVYNNDISHKEGIIITNARHQYAIKRSYDSLNEVIATINANMPMDCIVVDLRAAWEALGEITGDTLGEDIIDQIFSTFCIGK
jgi:tRNA modification GTPase